MKRLSPKGLKKLFNQNKLYISIYVFPKNIMKAKSDKIDIVFINPGDRKQIFQGLGQNIAGIEPPYWIAAMAAFLRNKGFKVAIIDANAENWTPEETAKKVQEYDPLLAAVIVYGSQPSASTQNMSISGKICRALKAGTNAKIAIGGLHPTALPERTLIEESVDFLIEGEGPFTLTALLEKLKDGDQDYSRVPGLWYREDNKIKNNPRAPLAHNLDEMLPIAAWDLLPMEKYRAHNWHCLDDIDHRSPYAAVYTSLGCPYSCTFCCINTPFGRPGIRYRSPESVVSEIEFLAKKYHIRNIKIIDELFVLNEKHYMAIVDLLIKRLINKGYPLNFWAYARIDSVNFDHLLKMKKAGINWLCLGIESGSEIVRNGVNKQIRRKDIIKVVRKIQDAGIYVMGNYIFGLPDDNMETMQETLNLALELNTEWANFYCTMAYPGSKLYETALKNKWDLPKEWHAYSQHSYETLPLPSKYLSAAEVLRFRDEAFHKYFTNPKFLSLIEKKFGLIALTQIKEMTKLEIKRKLFGD